MPILLLKRKKPDYPTFFSNKSFVVLQDFEKGVGLMLPHRKPVAWNLLVTNIMNDALGIKDEAFQDKCRKEVDIALGKCYRTRHKKNSEGYRKRFKECESHPC